MRNSQKKRQLMKMFYCSEQRATTILDFVKNRVYSEDCKRAIKNCNTYHLVISSLPDTYHLFTDIAEKKLKVKDFKIQNSEDFSKVELQWLEDNFKFRCKTKYILKNF